MPQIPALTEQKKAGACSLDLGFVKVGHDSSSIETERSGKRMLADVLWEAANERLWDGGDDYDTAPYGQWRFSCDAATCPLKHFAPDVKDRIKVFLRSLGCDTDSFDLFGEFAPGAKRQGVRYMWLLLAMHVAEDERIEL